MDQTIGDESRITAKGMGDADPVASNDTAAGRGPRTAGSKYVLNHALQGLSRQ